MSLDGFSHRDTAAVEYDVPVLDILSDDSNQTVDGILPAPVIKSVSWQSVSGGTATVVWFVVSGDVRGYKIENSASSEGPWTVLEDTTDLTTTTLASGSVVMFRLEPCARNSYLRVRAYNTLEGVPSAPQQAILGVVPV